MSPTTCCSPNLIDPALADAPDHRSYRYTFDNIAATVKKFLALRGIQHYALYMQDYGVPIGFRLLMDNPAAVTALMVQNGVVSLDGFPAAQDANGKLRRYWAKRDTNIDKSYADEVRKLAFPSASNWTASPRLNPEVVLLEVTSEQRPGVIEARNDLWFDYGTNVTRYPQWQAALPQTNAPVLIIWGSQDDFFTTPGVFVYLREAPRAEAHILNSTHFATLDVPEEIASLVQAFLHKHPLTS